MKKSLPYSSLSKRPINSEIIYDREIEILDSSNTNSINTEPKRVPTEEDLLKWKSLFEEAQYDKDFKILFHSYYDPITKCCPHGIRYPYECRNGCEDITIK